MSDKMFFYHKYIRRVFVCVVLIALGLRSLVPVGYMPDFSGTGKGLFPITICDGFEPSSMGEHSAHAGHMQHQHGRDHHHGDLCPFAGSTIVSYSGVDTFLAIHAVYALAPPVPEVLQQFYTQAVFSNASPRSPPSFSIA